MRLASSFSLAALIAVLLFCGLQSARAGQWDGPYIHYDTPSATTDGLTGVEVIATNPADTTGDPGNVSFDVLPQTTNYSYTDSYMDLTVANVYVAYHWNGGPTHDPMPTDFTGSYISVDCAVNYESQNDPNLDRAPCSSIEVGSSATITYGSPTYYGAAVTSRNLPVQIYGSGVTAGVATATFTVEGRVYRAETGNWDNNLRMDLIAGPHLPTGSTGGAP